MFYSHFILSKKAPLAKIWLAAHWEKKLSKSNIYDINVESSVENILNPQAKMALRTSGHLMLGVVRVHNRKARYLLADCNEAFVKIKMAFRPGAEGAGVDLPENLNQASFSAFTLPDVFHDLDTSLNDFADLALPTNFGINQSRVDEITLKEDFGTVKLTTLENDGFGDLNFDDREILRDSMNFQTPFLNLSSLTGDSMALKKDKTLENNLDLDGFGGLMSEALNNPPPSILNDAMDPPSVMPPSVVSSMMDEQMSVPPMSVPNLTGEISRNYNDQTTLIPQAENMFILEPREITSKDVRMKKKRKLIIDDNIKIQAAVMKAQMEDTTDIVTQLDLAPPSKKLMLWKETGGVDKLFTLPSRGAATTLAVVNYSQNLKQELPKEFVDEGQMEPKQIEDEPIEQLRESRASKRAKMDTRRTEEKNRMSAMNFQEPATPGFVDNVSLNMDPPTPYIEAPDFPGNVDFAVPSVQNDFNDGVDDFFGDLGGSPDSVHDPGSVGGASVASVQPADDEIFNQDADSDGGEEETAEESEERRWNKRTQQMVSILARNLLSKEYISFKALASQNNRKMAAAKFYTLLVLKKHAAIDVDQLQPFTDIIVSKGVDFNTINVNS